MLYSLSTLAVFLIVMVLAQAGSHPNPKQMFDDFKMKFGKSYANIMEEQARFAVFRKNLRVVERLNNLEAPNKPYGVSQFMDMGQDEFASTYLMKKVNLSEPHGHPARARVQMVPNLPSSFDWGSQAPDCVTAVKDQGQCGSCWAFSAVETIESVCCLAGYSLTVLSEQQIVDCDTDGGVMGCDGGWPEDVYTYSQRFGGLDTEANYPYEVADGTCVANAANKYACPITSWKFVSQDPSTEGLIQSFVYQNSPVSIAADAETWQFYTGGVVTAASCNYQQLDHAIQITGWQVVDGTPVWTVRNSWGESWGESGYIYLAIGTNTCGMALHVTVPCVQGANGSNRC